MSRPQCFGASVVLMKARDVQIATDGASDRNVIRLPPLVRARADVQQGRTCSSTFDLCRSPHYARTCSVFTMK